MYLAINGAPQGYLSKKGQGQSLSRSDSVQCYLLHPLPKLKRRKGTAIFGAIVTGRYRRHLAAGRGLSGRTDGRTESTSAESAHTQCPLVRF